MPHGLRYQIAGMWVEEARPKEELFIFFFIPFQHLIGTFCDPGIVMVLFGNVPDMVLRVAGSCRFTEPVTPVRTAVVFQPDTVMLSYMRFVGMITGKFYVLESIERTVELTPEVEFL